MGILGRLTLPSVLAVLAAFLVVSQLALSTGYLETFRQYMSIDPNYSSTSNATSRLASAVVLPETADARAVPPPSGGTSAGTEYASEQQGQPPTAPQPSHGGVIGSDAPGAAFRNQHPLCRKLFLNASRSGNDDGRPSPPHVLNAGNLWMERWEEILAASLFPSAEALDGATKDTYRNLLLDLSPVQLERALVSSPETEQVDRIWKILEDRRTNPATAPPLRILVMGGSVTEGVGCVQSGAVRGRACNWSVRLQSFVNHLLGYDAVRIINIAQGGTGTMQALSIVKYWIYPMQLEGKMPDVIVHAFGSNDSHLGPGARTEEGRLSELFRQGVDSLNLFTQAVLRSHPCPTPMIVHLDDYYGGHKQGALLGDFTYRMVLKEVAGWYKNMAVSSAQVVGPLVYPDTLGESTLSPPWQYKKGRKADGRYEENVHFGWGGHQAIVWSWAYSALKTMVSFCDHRDWEVQVKGRVDSMGEDRHSHTVPGVSELRGVAPPPLDFEMRLEDVSERWKEEKGRQDQHCEQTPEHPPCVMAWVGGPEGPTADAKKLTDYLQPYIVVTPESGWETESDMSHGWSRRLGFVAKEPNVTVIFEFSNVTVPLKVLTIQSLKSYGDAWQGSEALFTVTTSTTGSPPSGIGTNGTTGGGDWGVVASEVVSGYQNSTASTSHSTEVTFERSIEPGSDVRLEVKLIGGSTFKITGMMLCTR